LHPSQAHTGHPRDDLFDDFFSARDRGFGASSRFGLDPGFGVGFGGFGSRDPFFVELDRMM